MVDISIDNLLKDTKNKFLLVNAASIRAKQIESGSLPYIDEFDPTNPIITALREIALDKIKFKEVEKEVKGKKEEVKTKTKKDESVFERLSKGSSLSKGSKKKYTKKK